MNENATTTAAQLPAINEHMTATEIALICLRNYARERPEIVALWCFGIGFILGWKLKPW